MEKRPQKRKNKKRRQPAKARHVSNEAAALSVAMLIAATDRSSLEQLFKLALRAPDELIRDLAAHLIAYHGESVEEWLKGEPASPSSKEEFVEIVKPMLETATGFITSAQLFDQYLIKNTFGPDDIVFAFYTGVRLFVAKERKPTKIESKYIWDITLEIAQRSKIGARHWKELESQGKVHLDSWIEEVKEKARKKFQTFLNQKRQMEKNSKKTFKLLLSFLFDVDDENNQNMG